MNDILMTTGAHVGIVAVFITLVALIGGHRLRLSWLLIALAVYGVYVLALFNGDVFLQLPLLADLRALIAKSDWNWGGKIASFLATLAMTLIVALTVKDSRTRMGFTLKHNPGSVLPALAMAAAAIGAVVVHEISLQNGMNLSADRMLYQAVVPGLNEEPVFRGLLLFLLTQGLGDNERRFWHIGLGGLSAALLFGVVHGVAFQDGVVHSAFAIAVTGTLGLSLLWIRERTGSLVLPILVHNAINVAPSFF